LFSSKAVFTYGIGMVIWLYGFFHGIVILEILSSGTFYLILTQINRKYFFGFAFYWIIYVIYGKCVTAIGIYMYSHFCII